MLWVELAPAPEGFPDLNLLLGVPPTRLLYLLAALTGATPAFLLRVLAVWGRLWLPVLRCWLLVGW